MSKNSYKATNRSGHDSRGRPKSISDCESRRSGSSGGGNTSSSRVQVMHTAQIGSSVKHKLEMLPVLHEELSDESFNRTEK